jgi:poly-beta-1,6-N-acetyl-D-glucosamine synthase
VDLIIAIDSSVWYKAALFFFGFYPFSMAIIWITMGVLYFRKREVDPEQLAPRDFVPFVSMVIPAFDEEDTIGRTLEAALAQDYPDYEVVVVNDCSLDHTVDVIRPYLRHDRARLVDKRVNDILVPSDLLRAITPHFYSSRVGMVSGNPRVGNRGSLLRDLQTLEFTSIISVQRRAQRIWGRVLTGSGAIMAVRRTALAEVSGFTPSMATEDIDLTWRLQLSFWDVRYEPRAIVWMQVPPTIRELWKQRRRWARGLAQVLKRHRRCLLNWKQRRMWAVYGESVLSILWAYTFVLVTAFWAVAHLYGHAPLGTSPVPNLWGMLIATACLTQLLAGTIMDRRYDDKLMRYYPVAIFYPLVYWMLMSTITAIYTVEAIVRKPPATQRWNIRRVR